MKFLPYLSAAILFIASSASAEERSNPLRLLEAPEGPARGIAIGFDDGIFGDGMEGSLRLKVPLEFWGLGNYGFQVGPIYMLHHSDSGPNQYFGGRLHVFGQSAVLPNLLRLYGGMGVQVLSPRENPQAIEVLPYGQDGIEFFMTPRLSFYIEIGLSPSLNKKFPITGVGVFGVNYYLTEAR